MMSEAEYKIWLAGWNSASSVCEDALKALLKDARWKPETLSYELNQEAVHSLKTALADDLYKQMPVSSRGALDYYFASNLIKPKEVKHG
jgi:hypothetical protein